MAQFRILLIYDDPDLRRDIASALNTKGYYVATATNGAEGYDMAINREYDAIISSISLSHTDGITVLREWRQREMYAPVLVLTTRDRLSDKVECLEAGADDYLIVPFYEEELMARMAALLRRSQEYNSHTSQSRAKRSR